MFDPNQCYFMLTDSVLQLSMLLDSGIWYFVLIDSILPQSMLINYGSCHVMLVDSVLPHSMIIDFDSRHFVIFAYVFTQIHVFDSDSFKYMIFHDFWLWFSKCWLFPFHMNLYLIVLALANSMFLPLSIIDYNMLLLMLILFASFICDLFHAICYFNLALCCLFLSCWVLLFCLCHV